LGVVERHGTPPLTGLTMCGHQVKELI
jgi:hypothetical protein